MIPEGQKNMNTHLQLTSTVSHLTADTITKHKYIIIHSAY